MLDRLIAAALLVTVTTLFTTTAPTPVYAGKICKEKGFRGNSNAVFNITASVETRARIAWKQQCERTYANVWCDVWQAKKTRMICNQTSRGKLCEFQGTPCRNN